MADRYEFAPEPPQSVLDYMASKAPRVGFDTNDVWREEHAFAFTVAKVTDLAILRDVQESLVEARRSGKGFEAWKKDLRGVLETKGWAGKREVTDPVTGEVKTTNLTAPRRLRTIYETNTRTANAVETWNLAQETKAFSPFFLYRLGPSDQHRPDHVAMDGLILPVDDPFWDEWLPPNGWGCKCWLRQITRREAERLGYKSDPAPAVPPKPYKNPRTGEVSIGPQGIDPGFDSNPGKSRFDNMTKLFKGELEAAPDGRAVSAARDFARSPAMDEISTDRGSERRSETVPVAILPKPARNTLGTEVRRVDLSRDTAVKQVAKRPGMKPRDYAELQDGLIDPIAHSTRDRTTVQWCYGRTRKKGTGAQS